MPTRGPQAGPVIFTYTGLQPMVATLQALESGIDDIDMSGGVRAAGGVWQRNWGTQGQSVGGWKELSPYTQALRSYRGFAPQRPILRQSGNLKTVAADIPAHFKGRSTNRTVGGGYSGSSQTSLYITQGRNRATLVLTGDKVVNNFGGQTTGHGWQTTASHRVPQRRFWFVDDEVRTKVAESVVEFVKKLMGNLG